MLLLCLVSGIQIAGAKTEFTPVNRWYEVYLSGAKVGYFQDEMQKDGDVIKSRNEFVMQIKRAGQIIEITVEQETTEKISGELIDFFSETKMAGIPMLKIAIVMLLVAVMASLFSGLFFLIHDGGKTRRVVNSLAVRVALSVLLLALILVALWSGNMTLNPTP